MTKICIDNKETRERILSSRFVMKNVPSIVIVNERGGIELHEGLAAFDWVDAAYKYFIDEREESLKRPVSPPSQPQHPSPPPQQVREEIPVEAPPSPRESAPAAAPSLSQRIIEMQRDRERADNEIKLKNPQFR